MSYPYTFTVFTPTYNRAQTLPRVWESLNKQTYREFEWLIVDDGSTDNTREVVSRWIANASFPVRYLFQKHGHKKAAFNRGVQEARGYLFLTLDSDDECVPHALERFWWHWMNIPEGRREHYSAVTALWAYTDGTIVGTQFPGRDYLDSDTIEVHRKWKIKGDKWGFQRVDVLRQCAFPEDVSGHVPEGLIWSEIAQRYRTRYVNEVLGICHRDNGPEAAGRLSGIRNPIPHAAGQVLFTESVFQRQWQYFRDDPGYFIRMALNFTRFRLHTGSLSVDRIIELPGAWLILAMIPGGCVRYLADRWRHGSS